MALITSCAVLLSVVAFAIVATAFGHRLLRCISAELPNDLEQLLCCAAIGVIGLEVIVFQLQMLSHIRIGLVTVLLLVFSISLADFRFVLARIIRCLRSVSDGPASEKWLAYLAAAIMTMQGLAAMAPLTGSDALHYHFTAPLLVLKTGFHPNFFLSHSFLTGQSHLLILAGLALGSSQLAMGLMFLGGVLAAMAAVCLARQWIGRGWSISVAIFFLLTPVVFWQISGAGAPDIWMAFFTAMGVLVISRSEVLPATATAILAGAFAGGVAGAKYTGCIVAASMAVAYLWENRSLRGAAIFVSTSLFAGIWPYARNFVWTGDPIFPFLLHRLSSEALNTYTLASYLGDTGAGAHKSFLQILKFPFFAGLDSLHPGFWQFFGPIVLAFAPLIILVIRKTSSSRAALTVWILSALGIGVTSAMTRFLLPVFPIGLAMAIAGVSTFLTTAPRAIRYVALASLGVALAAGGGGLLVYDRAALGAATGFTPPNDYLRQRAPQYPQAEFINTTLSAKQARGNTLVFLRNTYYLQVPFLYGDPAASWAINPTNFQTPEEWLELFHRENIRWIVKAPNYPPTIAAPLNQLEAHGRLVSIAQSVVSDFQGMRMSEDRREGVITILQVKE